MSPSPNPPPPLNIPNSQSTVKVSIINSTSRIQYIPSHLFVEPRMKGFPHMDCPAYSFLIEQPSTKRKVLWDLGVRKDWENLAPRIVTRAKEGGWKLTIEKGVADILKDGGVDPGEIEAIIWSHHHWDHTGDPSTFPASTDLIVGPGFKANFLPGYPTTQDAPIRESDYQGRNLREITFENSSLQIGGFKAVDFFGDGSFYLLDSPGHAIGHMCALARTTASPSPPTFMFLGGDCAHHCSEFRPSPHQPLPDSISPSPVPRVHPHTCPASLLTPIHRLYSPHNDLKARTEPFCRPAPGGMHDVDEARESARKMAMFDAHEDVFTVIAHDPTMLEVAGFFPKQGANEWKALGWKEKSRWGFLRDFGEAIEEKIEEQGK